MELLLVLAALAALGLLAWFFGADSRVDDAGRQGRSWP
jgi:hypothetical protein